MNKKIIVGGPKPFNLTDKVIEELKSMGFEVTDLTYDSDGFRYKNAQDRVINFFNKVLFNSYQHKARLRLKNLKLDFNAIIDDAYRYDYGLFFRPDFYPIEIV